jgi:Phosphotransferase enzyme family
MRILSKQGGATVLALDDSLISKSGNRVRPSEEVAMRLVKQYTDVPVPDIILSAYDSDRGILGMTVIPGSPLHLSWDGLDEHTKERICNETWDIIAKLRQIPRATELCHLFQCSADGSPTHDPLIQGLDNPPTPLLNDAALRARIEERYLHYGGRRYAKELPSMLPHSDVSVFTHGDIAPRNIMVDETYCTTGILDWEGAGWYPDYWEYANILRPAYGYEDWQAWMHRTAPQRWDLTGIQAARRVLF